LQLWKLGWRFSLAALKAEHLQPYKGWRFSLCSLES
jgi:hypothetical protein